MLIEAILAGLLGLLVGSFLNACIYRLPNDISLSHPKRSFCPQCGSMIAWYDNLPVLSWLALGGRCRSCRTPISWRYPLVELVTGACFAGAAWRFGFSGETLRLAVYSALLIVLFSTDLATRILPDQATVGGACAGWMLALAAPMPAGLIAALLPASALPAGVSLAESVLGGALPALGLWSIGEVYRLVRGRDGLGFGDVKMILMIGSFQGLEGTMLTLIVGSLLGTAAGLILLWRQGKKAAQYELPFGSFLAAAGLLLAHWPI
jgi:leader peptidase (prepilin peptidase)/N-methyltransferase